MNEPPKTKERPRATNRNRKKRPRPLFGDGGRGCKVNRPTKRKAR